MSPTPRSWLLALALAGAACALKPPPPKTTADRPVAADAPRPAWVHRAPFAVTSSAAVLVYATAHAPLPGGAGCADPARVLDTAAGRARAAIVRALEDGGAVATGNLRGGETVAAWLDSAGGAAHVLVGAPVPAAPRVEAGDAAWISGERPSGVAARMITAERARFEAAGVCTDPHRRADFPCCGPVDQMCHDPSRFDTQTPPRCACGEARGPCLQDFACETGRCVCRGAACPCDILKCRGGQTCGDGRCY